MAAIVCEMYARHMNIDLMDPTLWFPSDRWCQWYLEVIAGYVRRRHTQGIKSPEETEIHKRVHEYNVRKIAYLLSLGMHPKYISGSDGENIY